MTTLISLSNQESSSPVNLLEKSKTNFSQKYPSLESLIEFYDKKNIENHYFDWLHSRPVDLASIWLLLHNLRGITADFIRWLSGAVSRIDDNVIRCLLVKQLYDELGNGKVEKCHIVLYDRFYNAFEPYQHPSIANGEMDNITFSAPGLKLRQRLESYFNSPDPVLVITAFLVGEIYAMKFNTCLNEQVARTDKISERDLTWLRLHTVVEAEHASDSIHLARRLEEIGVSRDLVWMAAEEVWDIFIRFQDEMHQLNLQIQ